MRANTKVPRFARDDNSDLVLPLRSCRLLFSHALADFEFHLTRFFVGIDYDVVAHMRADLNKVVAKVKDALDQIQATGCIVKDLDSGLVDFPSMIKDEEVYLCWRLGEDRIRFYHRQDEGFSGRKPINPEDTGPQHPIQ